MDEIDWESLFKANAELNSPKVQAIHKEAERLQKFCNQENQRTEPIEATLQTPYTETADFIGQLQDIVQTEGEIANQIQELRSNLESEKQARLKSEKINTRFQWANLILVALTLIATIIFGLGLHSCAGTAISDTSGTQGLGFVTTGSSPAKQS